jgi:hypothetical protein
MLVLRALAVVVTFILGSGGLAQGTGPAPKLRVAVADFEVRGGNADLGKNLADAFAAPLFQTKRFELYDRRQTVALLNEVRFTQLGLAEQAQQLQSRNIDVLVTGTLNINSADSLRVDVLFTNVRTAQVQFADSIDGTTARDFPAIANRLVEALAKEFPLQGTILGADSRNANRYYITVGSGSNVTVGQQGKLFQFQTIAGRQIPVEAGSFRVVELSLDPGISVIEVVNLTAGYKPKEGDAVTISLAGPSAPPVVSGRLSVRSSAGQATVLVDGQARGTIASAGGTLEVPEVTPGQHTVVVRAPGFEDATQAVTVTSGSAARVELNLRPVQTTPQSAASGVKWPPSESMRAGQVWTVNFDGQAPIAITISEKDKDGDWIGTVKAGSQTNPAYTFLEGSAFVFQVGSGSASNFCVIPGTASIKGNALTGNTMYRKSNSDPVQDLKRPCTVTLGAATRVLAWPVLPYLEKGQQWTFTIQGISPWTVTFAGADEDGDWTGEADIGDGDRAHVLLGHDPSENVVDVAFADNTGVVICEFSGAGSIKDSVLTGKAYTYDVATKTPKDLNLACTATPKR